MTTEYLDPHTYTLYTSALAAIQLGHQYPGVVTVLGKGGFRGWIPTWHPSPDPTGHKPPTTVTMELVTGATVPDHPEDEADMELETTEYTVAADRRIQVQIRSAHRGRMNAERLEYMLGALNQLEHAQFGRGGAPWNR